MNTPHLLKICHPYQIGQEYKFCLTGMNISAPVLGGAGKFHVKMSETHPQVTWTVVKVGTPTNNSVDVTAVPTLKGVAADGFGGGDGGLTITVDNGTAPDPAPPVVPTYYEPIPVKRPG